MIQIQVNNFISLGEASCRDNCRFCIFQDQSGIHACEDPELMFVLGGPLDAQLGNGLFQHLDQTFFHHMVSKHGSASSALEALL